MARSKPKIRKAGAVVVPNNASRWPEGLYDAVVEEGGSRFLGFVLVTDNELFGQYWRNSGKKPWETESGPRRIVILWQAESAVSAVSILDWRSALIEEGEVAYRIESLPAEPSQNGWRSWLKDLCETKLGVWAAPVPEPEPSALRVGSQVIQRGPAEQESAGSYDPAFVTVPVGGKMSEVIDHLDMCKRRYRDAIGGDLGTRREAVLERVQELLMFDPERDRLSPSEISDRIREIQAGVDKELSKRNFLVERRKLPKILLLGPSGAGKTLVARYLAWRTSPGQGERLTRPFKRVSIPEYLADEQRFAFDVLGYTTSAYTGARKGGSRGILLERLGGVIFFDEIGEASPAIQSKLLPYLDDYCVTPVGWEGDPVVCPMLIIAATNRPIDEWAEDTQSKPGDPGYFRNDLYRRFDVIVRIPSLGERADELPAIIDAMLQIEHFNPTGRVSEVGEAAMGALCRLDYSKGNFRTLERVLRGACDRAIMQGRNYLVGSDVASGN